jgi:hypothetical protein
MMVRPMMVMVRNERKEASMKDIAREIKITVNEASSLLARMKPDELSSSDNPDKWSKKEILGHLIDSAANNHQRFVRASYNAAATFPQYSQNDWVRIQRYNESEWAGLVALWSAYNRHLSDVIERIPPDAFSSPCNIGKEEPVPLEFVIRDYLRHLRHHVNQILEGAA